MNYESIGKRLWIIAVGIITLVAMMEGLAFAATYNLRAASTNITIDNTEIPMWGFALISFDIGQGLVMGDNLVKVPGPKLTIPPGPQSLIINLTNELSEPVSIIIPGQAMPLEDGATDTQVERTPDGRVRSFTYETPTGGMGTYNWTSFKPGTYLYHSGTHPAVQVQMGLYGAITKDAVAGLDPALPQAYPGKEYNQDVTILYSEIDPALHEAVQGGTYGTPAFPSTINYSPKYFLVNGEVSNTTDPVATVVPDDFVLLRFLNAGLKTHAPVILGLHVDLIAEDGNLYPYPKKQYSLLLPAGKTLDALVTPPAGDYPIFDRRLYRSIGPVLPEDTMHTYLYLKAEVAP